MCRFGVLYKLLDVFDERELLEDDSSTAEFENVLVTAYAQHVKKRHAAKKELKRPLSKPIYDLETLTSGEEVIERVKSIMPNEGLADDVYLKLRFQIDDDVTNNKYKILVQGLNGFFISDNSVLTRINDSAEHNFFMFREPGLKSGYNDLVVPDNGYLMDKLYMGIDKK